MNLAAACGMTWNEQAWRSFSPSLRHSTPGKHSAVEKEQTAGRFRRHLDEEAKLFGDVLTCWWRRESSSLDRRHAGKPTEKKKSHLCLVYFLQDFGDSSGKARGVTTKSLKSSPDSYRYLRLGKKALSLTCSGTSKWMSSLGNSQELGSW